MKYIFSVLTVIWFISIAFSQNFRDSIDVIHYDIHLQISVQDKYIQGWTAITFVVDNSNIAKFDLLNLNVSKIEGKNIKNWNYNKSVISINFKKNLTVSDTQKIKIYYKGKPKEDPFWGGFYFRDQNAFNMGVGMESIPHPFGRVWFPCIDNFTDKATYDFFITVKKYYTAVCGGLLVEKKTKKGFTTYHWKLNNPIPTYLASVSVGKYEKISWIYEGINKKIPVEIYVFEGDKENAKKSLENLNNALAIFEKLYGNYRWDIVKYSAIKFTGGAMEHAENISMPRLAFNGTKLNEKLLYHELSHSWFGNLVTCKSSYDMWLNEGWTTYSEDIFLQYNYGEDDFKKDLRQKHLYAINFAHKNDNGYKAVANMDLNHTYGTTVYKKGCGVVHTLRYYLGDTLFFPAVRAYLDSFAFKNASTDDLMKFFSNFTKTDLKPFFDFWVYSKGFPYFFKYDWQIIDSTNNTYTVAVSVGQRTIGTDKLANNNRIEISFFDNHLNRIDKIFCFSGKKATDTFKIKIKPVYIALDIDERTSDATTDLFYIVSNTGTYIFDEALADAVISKVNKKSILRIQCNWLEPDNIEKKHGYLFQKNYYWTVEGSFDEKQLQGELHLYLTRLMDMNFSLLRHPEDFVLFYRENPLSDWQLIDFKLVKTREDTYIKTKLKKGDFALAVKIYE